MRATAPGHGHQAQAHVRHSVLKVSKAPGQGDEDINDERVDGSTVPGKQLGQVVDGATVSVQQLFERQHRATAHGVQQLVVFRFSQRLGGQGDRLAAGFGGNSRKGRRRVPKVSLDLRASVPPASSAYGQGLYTAGQRAATYDALLDRAAREAGLGRTVILDATWASDTDRSAARTVAENAGADLVELECVTPGPVTLRRLADRAKRGGDPSDATAPVAVAMSDDWQPWTGAHRIDSDRPGKVVLVEAIAAVGCL